MPLLIADIHQNGTVFDVGLKLLSMKVKQLLFAITIAAASLAACHTSKQSASTTASVFGKTWKLVELNGARVQPGAQSAREPSMMLHDSDKRVSGSGGCNSYFGSYELQGDTGITFSKIGSTKMACASDVMQLERNLFDAFESVNGFRLVNDTLFLTKDNRSSLAKFLVVKAD
ncbi:MAG: META domain-containing protein [Proteobacteria bacterium]|nr:MAG: META domain-containing protein [Pseudomonadota bacterium]